MPTAKEKIVQGRSSGQYPRNAAETRQRILAAASALFSQDIYKNVGTRDIASAAGVNLTLINRYFGSKKQLFSEVILSMKNFELASDVKQLEREVLADLLSEADNPRKQKLRLLLMGAMDSEVSEVVVEFFRRRKGRVLGSREDGHETLAFLQLASLVGISLTFSLLPEEDRASLDKEFIMNHFAKTLEDG
jgi:AcrR family transcriptional regulator